MQHACNTTLPTIIHNTYRLLLIERPLLPVDFGDVQGWVAGGAISSDIIHYHRAVEGAAEVGEAGCLAVVPQLISRLRHGRAVEEGQRDGGGGKGKEYER
jgi:hypothetical protein